MRRSCLLLSLLVIILIAATSAFAFRCGNRLVQVGDKTFEIIQKCGEPISKESVGYTLVGADRKRKREFEIKEWVYGPHGNQYRYLTFHGTTLVNIESRRK